jgi:hypothetical protein
MKREELYPHLGPRNEKQAKNQGTTMLGLGRVVSSMVSDQKKRAARKPREPRNEKKAKSTGTKMLGLGHVVSHMVSNQKKRATRGRPNMPPVIITDLYPTVVRLLREQWCLDYYTGLPLAIYGTKTLTPWDIFKFSVDRVNPLVGYDVPGNLVVTSHPLNSLACQDPEVMQVYGELLARATHHMIPRVPRHQWDAHYLYAPNSAPMKDRVAGYLETNQIYLHGKKAQGILETLEAIETPDAPKLSPLVHKYWDTQDLYKRAIYSHE